MAEVAPGTSKIFVRYRNAKPTEDELREIFSKHGTITEVKLYAKFCFIEYDSEASAEVAVASENGTVFRHVPLEVETVVRNVQKRKSDESGAEANASMVIAAPESQAAPTTACAVKKLKEEVLQPDIKTKNLGANKVAEAAKVRAAEAAKVRAAEAEKVKAAEAAKVRAAEAAKVRAAEALKVRAAAVEKVRAAEAAKVRAAEAEKVKAAEAAKVRAAEAEKVNMLLKRQLNWSSVEIQKAISVENARNFQKRKSDESGAEANASMAIAAPESQEAPTTACAVKKLKEEVLQSDVKTKALGANKEAEAAKVRAAAVEKVRAAEAAKVKAAEVQTVISVESTQGKQECEAEMEESDDASESNEASNLISLVGKQSRLFRNRCRQARVKGGQVRKAEQYLLRLRSLYPEKFMDQQSDENLSSGLKSKDLYEEPSSENKSFSVPAHQASSASRSHDDKLPSSYDPTDPTPVYQDYASNSSPAVNSQPYNTTAYNWSGYSPAEQTYTTAYPNAGPRSYSSNYAAECSQVSAYGSETGPRSYSSAECSKVSAYVPETGPRSYSSAECSQVNAYGSETGPRSYSAAEHSQVSAYGPATSSYYGSREKADGYSGLKQADQSTRVQSHRSWSDTQEGYSMRVGSTSLGNGDRSDLPDLVNYSSPPSSAKPSSSDMKPKESRDPDYGSSVESYKTSMSRAATSSSKVASSVAESEGHARSDAANEHSGVCELIITEPNLRHYGLKVASKIHSTGLKVEISDLPPGMTIMEEVEDALIRGRLFAVVITERHVEHNSVTVDVLHGVAEEHRNMVLDDAVHLIANSYQDYMTAKRASEKSSTVSESSKDVADIVPDECTQVLITRLARNQHLTYEELEEIISYLKKRQDALRTESSVPSSLPSRKTAPEPKIESVDVKLQKKLEATIFSILKGDVSVQKQAASTKPTHPTYPPAAGSYLPSGHYGESGEPYASNEYRRY